VGVDLKEICEKDFLSMRQKEQIVQRHNKCLAIYDQVSIDMKGKYVQKGGLLKVWSKNK